MTPTRKQIAAALLAQLTAGGQFTGGTGRRDRRPEQAASPNKPGLYLVKPREEYKYETDDRGVPPRRDLLFLAVIYTDVGTDATAVPADQIDDLLDAIDSALAPGVNDRIANGGRQTLGGLVYDCRIDGEIEFAPGDDKGKGETAVPIHVVLNSYP
jgi:hypothetical protein